MRKKRTFLISSLVAAGFSGGESESSQLRPELVDVNSEDAIVKRLQLQQKYHLAGHRSHSSHRSHGSHRSSSGGGYVTRTPSVSSGSNSNTNRSLLKAPNSNSTSPSSILPSTPAARAKTLPGNAGKFKEIVMQVQMAMSAFGYYNGVIDGVIGQQSKTALALMQKDFNLKVTGTVTPELLFVLGISTE